MRRLTARAQTSDFNPLPSYEGRRRGGSIPPTAEQFQSTPPHTRGDGLQMAGIERERISIHSPHARGDVTQDTEWIVAANFNPLPSCEGRLAFKRL